MLGRCSRCRWPALLQLGGLRTCLHCKIIFLGAGTTTMTAGSPPAYSAGERPTRTVVLTAAGAILGAASAPTRSVVDGANFAYTVLDYPLLGAATQAFWVFRVPNNFDGTANITATVYWIGSAINTNPTWGIAGLGRIDSDTWDAVLGGENTTADSEATTTNLATTAITWTVANHALVAGNVAVVRIRRTAGATGNARFLGAELRFLVTS